MDGVDDIGENVKRETEESNCCFCLRQDNLLSLLDTPASESKYVNYAAMISDCFQIEMITSNEIYLKHLYAICEFCLSRLRVAFNFRIDVQNGLKRIKNIVANKTSSTTQQKMEPDNNSQSCTGNEIYIKSEIFLKQECEDEMDSVNSFEPNKKEESNVSEISTNIKTECQPITEYNLPVDTEIKESSGEICVINNTRTLIPNAVQLSKSKITDNSKGKCLIRKNNWKKSDQTMNKETGLSCKSKTIVKLVGKPLIKRKTSNSSTLNKDADLSTLAPLVRDEKTALEFFQICGILPQRNLCPNGHEMYITNRDKSLIWVCARRTCAMKKGVRRDTWFHNSKIPLATAVQFIYYWSKEMTSAKFCTEQVGLSSKATTLWSNMLRDICAWRVGQYDSQIGGEGLHVEIYGTVINNPENNPKKTCPQCIFAGVCKETKSTFIVPVPGVSIDNLFPVILEKIKPGTVIISHDSHLYSNMSTEQYVFVSPESVDQMKDVGSVFAFIHSCHLKQKGIHKKMLTSNVAEWLWRLKLGEKNAFEEILGDIVAYWKATRESAK